MNWINGNDGKPPVTKEGALLSAKYKSKPFSIICLVADDGVLKWHWCEHTMMREFGGHRWIKDEEWGEVQWLDESQPEVIEAARELIDSKFWQYKSKNGRMMSIEDASGEKCWIVPDEKIQRLQDAIESQQLAGGQSAGVEDMLEILKAFDEISHVCGTVNFSSHTQMREAIKSALSISDTKQALIRESLQPATTGEGIERVTELAQAFTDKFCAPVYYHSEAAHKAAFTGYVTGYKDASQPQPSTTTP
jgi:hypothetical protein